MINVNNGVYTSKLVTNSIFIPDSLENSIENLSNAITKISDTISKIGYWINPANLHHELGELINHPNTSNTMIGATIIASWFIVIGSKRAKRWTANGLLIYFMLKVVFAI